MAPDARLRPSTASPTSPTATPVPYTIMVAGNAPGKSSFLRLLVHAAHHIHLPGSTPAAANERERELARFLRAAESPTTQLKSVTLDILTDQPDSGDGPQLPVSLTLVDTPSIDMSSETALDRSLAELVRSLDSRFAESLETAPQKGNNHVHLCIYFLDPDSIYTSSNRSPSCSLPATEIKCIRSLSCRVNVLPVIGRADTITTHRLAAIKHAIRRDLADAGIGFGVFDSESGERPLPESVPQPQVPSAPANGKPLEDAVTKSSSKSSPTHFSSSGRRSSPSSNVTTPPPTSPDNNTVPQVTVPRLPHAVISPDFEYTPGICSSMSRFTRCYRWGVISVLDANHCDFARLKRAIFEHMLVLKDYTQSYLYKKFCDEHHEQIGRRQPRYQYPPYGVQNQHRPRDTNNARPAETLGHSPQRSSSSITSVTPASVSLPQVHYPPPQPQQLPPISAVAGAVSGYQHHQPQQAQPPQPQVHPSHQRGGNQLSLNLNTSGMSMGSGNASVSSAGPSTGTTSGLPSASLSPEVRSASRASMGEGKKVIGMEKQKNKKITVACNFCRSRKLKCDGGRPACGQCVKRSHTCDYMAQSKRRGGHPPTGRPRRRPVENEDVENEGGEAVDELDAEDDADAEGEVDNVAKMEVDERNASARGNGGGRGYVFSMDNKPLIAPLPFSGAVSQPSPSSQQPPVPVPIRPASETQAAQRKKATGSSSGSGAKSDGTPTRTRVGSNYGPKVVACHFCRARKTKCDGVHPSCSSCTRRSLPCSYVNDPPQNTNPPPSFGAGSRKSGPSSTNGDVSMKNSTHVSPTHSRPVSPPPLSATSSMHVSSASRPLSPTTATKSEGLSPFNEFSFHRPQPPRPIPSPLPRSESSPKTGKRQYPDNSRSDIDEDDPRASNGGLSSAGLSGKKRRFANESGPGA